MAGIKSKAFYIAIIFACPFITSCDQDGISTKDSASSRQVIQLKNDSKILYRGKAVEALKDVPISIENAFLTPDGKTPVHKIGELSIQVDEKTTIGFAKKVMYELQAAGYKVAICYGEQKIPAPPMAVQATDEPGFFVSIKLRAEPNETLSDIELKTGKGETLKSFTANRKNLDELVQRIQEELDEWLTKDSSDLAIEFNAPENLLAHELVAIFAAANSLAEQQEAAITVWPFGYPREQAPEIPMIDGF